MKWPEEKIEQLHKLCFEEKPNAEIAEILGLDIKEIHAARSRLGITIAKVKEAKAAAAKEATPADTLGTIIAESFDHLDRVLLDAAQFDPDNAQVLRQVAAGVSIYKALLLNSIEWRGGFQ